MNKTKTEEKKKTEEKISAFMVKKSKSIEYQKLQWILRAASIDDCRYSITGVHVDSEKNMVATDGCRMHVWRDCPIEQIGFFQVIETRIGIIFLRKEDDFPNWKKLIKKKLPEVLVNFDLPHNIKDRSFGSSIFKLFSKTNACFNISYLLDLASYKHAQWTVYGNDPDAGWLFRCRDMEAVIMPMNTREI